MSTNGKPYWMETIDRQLSDIEREIMQNDGIVTPEQELAIDQLCHERVERAVDMSYHLGRRIAEMKEQLKIARQIVALLEARHEHYREISVEYMDRGDVKAVQGKTYRAGVRKSPGRIELCVEPQELPAQYRREKVVYEADTDLLKAALRAGIVVTTEDGRECARYTEGRHLFITVNKDEEAIARLEELTKEVQP